MQKTGLASETYIENLVGSVTQAYLRKFAQDTSKDKANQAMDEFIERHQNYDIKEQLENVQHKIALELYNISRVVDDGNFHKVLENNSPIMLNMIYDIPVCCKINLDGQLPPLHIKLVSLKGPKSFKYLKVFASYKEIEPMAGRCEMDFSAPKGGLIRLVGERGHKPSVKVFKAPFLYITFVSEVSTSIEVRPSFIDPSKA